EPFVADEYTERLVWRTPGGGSRGGPEAFDPKRLLEEFNSRKAIRLPSNISKNLMSTSAM
ncbi:hypothetical protein FD754_025345, partial [Muntiacus muntjak]